MRERTCHVPSPKAWALPLGFVPSGRLWRQGDMIGRGTAQGEPGNHVCVTLPRGQEVAHNPNCSWHQEKGLLPN